LGDLELIAFRHETDRPIARSELAAWRERGLRVLAVRTPSSRPLPPTTGLHDLVAGTELIVAGPEPVLEEGLGISVSDR